MCNIAGYAGTERAAPILLEMLKKQQYFDGGVCAGIATVHNGRLYYRKVVGDVDTLMAATDALYLPGNVGIAHTRPLGDPETYSFAHPFITADETMAAIMNGTAKYPGYSEKAQAATALLESEGYSFRDNAFLKDSSFPRLEDGSYISCVSTRMGMVDRYIKQGMSVTGAMARTVSELYTDNVLGILNVATPDRFYVLRTTRPAVSLKTEDGVYVATTRFAFPENKTGEVAMLPLYRACELSREGVKLTDDVMRGCEEVAEVTERTLEEGYARISALFKGKQSAPLNFDDLEIAVGDGMRDLFEGDHTLVQDARLVYDVLYRLHEEGLLKTELRSVSGRRKRFFMWI